MAAFTLSNSTKAQTPTADIKSLIIDDIDSENFPDFSNNQWAAALSNVTSLLIRNIDYDVTDKLNFNSQHFFSLSELKLLQAPVNETLTIEIQNLKLLYVYKSQNLKILSLKNCESLELLKLNVNKQLQQVTDNDSTSNSLKEISIDHCNSLKLLDINDTENVTDLKILECGSLKKFKNSEFPSLSSYNIIESGEGGFEIRGKNIALLSIRGCNKLRNLNLNHFPNLTSLETSWCEQLERVVVGDIARVQQVSLSQNENLKTLDFKTDLPYLEEINLNYSGIVDIKFREEFAFKKLRLANISGCAKLGLSGKKFFNLTRLYNIKEFRFENSSLDTINFSYRLVFNEWDNLDLVVLGLRFFLKEGKAVTNMDVFSKTLEIFQRIKNLVLTSGSKTVAKKFKILDSLSRIFDKNSDMVLLLNIAFLLTPIEYFEIIGSLSFDENRATKLLKVLENIQHTGLVKNIEKILEPHGLSIAKVYQASPVLFESHALKVYESHSDDACPVCLEDYGQAGDSRKPLIYSKCGHSICSECSKSYDKTKCFICQDQHGKKVDRAVLEAFKSKVLVPMDYNYGEWDKLYSLLTQMVQVA